jgi:hypothetical protein
MRRKTTHSRFHNRQYSPEGKSKGDGVTDVMAQMRARNAEIDA